jgi:hypothetical protein
MNIELIDGPYAGVKMQIKGGGSVLMEGDLPNGEKTPEGMFARYRPTRDKSKWRFREWDKSVIRIPRPS